MKSKRPEQQTRLAPLAMRVFDRGSRWTTLAATILLVSAAFLTGCAPFRGLRENLQYNDSMNDFVMGWRNAAWARQAWHEHKYLYVEEPQFVTFGQGFRDGYADVAGGASGCVPGLPPRSYWTWKYQTGEGQAKVAAWFAGYPHGARAAQEDGAGNFQQIQVSHLIEAQYSPEFRSGKCPGCDPATFPGGPGIEQLPEGFDPAPTPIPASPAPMTDPTSQLDPRGTWSRESMIRIPRPVVPYFPNTDGAVTPASAQFPVQ